MWNKNRAFRRFVMIIAAVAVIVTALFNIAACKTLRDMSEGYYSVISVLLENAKEQNPDFREEEWIEILNRNELKTSDVTGLERYGISLGDMPALSQQKYAVGILAAGNVLLVLMAAATALLSFFYQRRRDLRIDELTGYIRKIEQGIYALDMEDNGEDELSGLKSELYKVTVMLRESANLSKDQKRALADSVSDISHQLKTPLTSCLVLLDNLSESEDMDEETRHRFLAEITRQLTGINWLVVTLLKLSRMDAGVVEFDREKIDIDAMIYEVFENLALISEWKQIALVKEGREGVIIYGDRHWIKEAVTNLVKNAIEHSPENDCVEVSVDDNTVYTAVSITDFGEGISAGDQKHIFERFYRSSRAKSDSTGIGLALSKEIIERQNGYITVSSEEGKGTRFLIKFIKS